jgi:threonine dehydrogenase-like Zn-dependent dehydrogenase
MAEYTEVRGERLKNLLRIPDHIDYETAATVEPLCNPTHSYHLREPEEGETVAIFGAGVLGLGYLQIVKSKSTAKTIISDVSDLRLDMARKIGADYVIDAKSTDPLERIKEITGEYEVRYMDQTAGGCDITVESAGIGVTFSQCLEALKPEDGTAIIAAAYEVQFPIEPNLIIFKYMRILGSMGYTDQEAEEAMDLIGSGLVDRGMLISHRLPLDEAPRGFELQSDPKSSVKVMIVMP